MRNDKKLSKLPIYFGIDIQGKDIKERKILDLELKGLVNHILELIGNL